MTAPTVARRPAIRHRGTPCRLPKSHRRSWSTDVGKRFRLFADRRTNLKEVFTQRRRQTRYEEFWAFDVVSLDDPQGVDVRARRAQRLRQVDAAEADRRHPPADRGHHHLDGRISALLELGAGFHPELSGRDNIYLNGAILGMSRKRIDAAIDEIIEFSGIGHFVDVPVKVYSSGMYVRLGFAIAVTLDPEILVIDEIIAVGDEEFQRRCFDYLHKLRSRGVTIVFVTHSMGLVQQLCDSAAWLENGQIKIVGTADEVVNAYIDTVNAAESSRLSDEIANAEVQGDGADGLHAALAPSRVGRSKVHDRGTGEVTIDRLEFIDRLGQTRTTAIAGDPLTVRVHYAVTTPTEDVVFGLGFQHDNGTLVAGPNMRTSGAKAISAVGDGYVDYRIDPLPLNPGTYDISAAVVDVSLLHHYDHWIDAAKLSVQPGHGAVQAGLVALPGEWITDAAIPSTPADAQQ